jgi:hypothetical protein
MKKSLTSLIALAFALAFGSAFAAKHMDEAVAKACKDKKPGTEVTVDGKKVACPEAKK